MYSQLVQRTGLILYYGLHNVCHGLGMPLIQLMPAAAE